MNAEPGRKIRVLFFGTPEIADVCLRALLAAHDVFEIAAVITQPDRPAGRGKSLQSSPVKRTALEHQIPVLQPVRLRKELETITTQLNEFGPFDVGVVVAFGQILPAPILDLPRAGCVNLHASLLPRWRGAAPIHRAIMSGDHETGICLMKMDQGLDTGDVYAVERLPIAETETTGSLHDTIARHGAALLAQQLPTIVSGALPAQPQPTEGITYAAKIENNESLVDWARPAAEVCCLIRGLEPFPGAFTTFQTQRLKLFQARMGQYTATSAKPGAIVLVDNDGVEIQCADSSVRVSMLQLEGRKRLSVPDFLKGTALKAGDRFGAC